MPELIGAAEATMPELMGAAEAMIPELIGAPEATNPELKAGAAVETIPALKGVGVTEPRYPEAMGAAVTEEMAGATVLAITSDPIPPETSPELIPLAITPEEPNPVVTTPL